MKRPRNALVVYILNRNHFLQELIKSYIYNL